MRTRACVLALGLLACGGPAAAPAQAPVVIGNVAPVAAADEPDDGDGGDGRSPADDTLPNGTRVRITQVDREDAYFDDRLSIEGLECTVEEQASLTFRDCYGGQFACDNGKGYYFYAACLELL